MTPSLEIFHYHGSAVSSPTSAFLPPHLTPRARQPTPSPPPPTSLAKLEYLFGASGQAAIGKRKLRVRIGPSADCLKTAAVNDEAHPHFIDSPFFTGNVCVRVKNFAGHTPDGSKPIATTPYFANKKRLFAIQVSGRFKHEYSAEDVVFGAEFEHKVSPPTGAWVAIKFANLIDPALKTDLYAEKPWLFSPMLCSMNIVNVEKANAPVVNAHPSDPKADAATEQASVSSKESVRAIAIGPDMSYPRDAALEVSSPAHLVTSKPSPEELLTKWTWVGEKELEEDTALLLPSNEAAPFPPDGIAERRKHFQKPKARQNMIFKPENVYNFEIFAPFIDLNTFDLTLGININLLGYMNNQPIRLMSKSWTKNIPFFVIEFDLVEDGKQ
ncbi:hypothetical protein BDK51DRAFT_32657 [Blyttiomyces helicus]|uniref:Domain of unknown function at the cortex 1 domain-containing protein n=1 Tax=Blyttiomyces helicus TaxID=388810 RepID=A0A4P9W7K1_9FUNG|nr:hypothetical protein BDK51DRAFT_32657 [Blyttiomyces helicus]|eukprot:RKO88451.1 hypothetical protein BDK51DRAFT_32657 [Blyttiomyces helicus]